MTDLAQGRTGQQQERPRSADQELRARARAVIPGGMYGHQNAGPLPPEVQLYTAFSIAVGLKAQQPDAAKALIAFLRAPALVPVLKAKGLEPG